MNQFTTTVLPTEIAQAAGLVGRTVCYRSGQWKIHSVEGLDWYAHQDDNNPGEIVIDTGMTRLSHLAEPRVIIHPAGTKVGDAVTLVEIDLNVLVSLMFLSLEA